MKLRHRWQTQNDVDFMFAPVLEAYNGRARSLGIFEGVNCLRNFNSLMWTYSTIALDNAGIDLNNLLKDGLKIDFKSDYK